MYGLTWEQFKNLPRFKDLDIKEQARQFFLYEAQTSVSSASSAAGAGAGGSGGRVRSDFANDVLVTIQIPGEDNWKYFILDSQTGKITQLFDTGIPSSWSQNYDDIVHSKGYVIYFSNGGSYKGLFISANGTIVDSFTTYSYNSYDLDGKAVIVTDPDGGDVTIYWFDGTSVSKNTFTGINDYGMVDEWDYSSSDGTTCYRFWYDDRVDYYLIGPNGFNFIHSTSNGDPINTYVWMQAYSDTVFLMDRNTGTDCYQMLKVLTTGGNLIDEVGLTYSNLTSFNDAFYGYNNFQIVFWDYSSNAVDYQFYNYSGGTLSTYTHPRGTNYEYISTEYNTPYQSDGWSYRPGSVVNLIYSEGNSYDNYFDEGSERVYSKAIYFFGGDDAYQEYSINNAPLLSIYNINGTPAVSGTFSGVLQTSTTGDGTGAVFQIISDGINYTDVIVTSGGASYSYDDIITISGTALGGTATTNDITFNVSTNAWVTTSFYLECGEDYANIQVKYYGDDHTTNVSLHPAGLSPSVSTYNLADTTNINSYYKDRFGDNEVYAFFYYDGSWTTVYKVCNDTSVLATATFSGNVGNYRYQNNTLFIRDWNTNQNYYWNETSGGIVEIDTFYSQREYVNNHKFEGNVNEGAMVLFNPPYYSGPSFRILTPTTLSSDVEVISSGSWWYDLGSSNLAYVFSDESGFITIDLYDFTGTLVKRVETEYDTLDNWVVSGDIFFFVLYNSGGDETAFYIVTPNATSVKSLVEDNYDYTINDYRWWN